MYVDSLNLVLTQISVLVNNLDKDNFASSRSSLASLSSRFGLESRRHYLRCLFSSTNFTDPTQTPLHCRLLEAEVEKVIVLPTAASLLCFAIDSCFPKQKTLKPSLQLFNQIAKATKQSKTFELLLALALHHSEAKEQRRYSAKHCKRILPVVLEAYSEKPSNPREIHLQTVPQDVLLKVLAFITDEQNSGKYHITADLVQAFLDKLREQYPRESVPLLLSPILYENKQFEQINVKEFYDNYDQLYQEYDTMDTSWINLILEIGYDFTANVEDCKTNLRCGRDLQVQDIAKIIGLVCRTHTNLLECNVNLPTPANFWPGQSQNGSGGNGSTDAASSEKKDAKTTGETTQSWKPEVLVQALKEVVPNLNWKEVCFALDHPEFIIKDRIGLNLLLTIFRLGTASPTFPTECIYRHWQNIEGQFSLISTIFKNPDLFSFADYIFASVPVELLKTPPESENKEIASWKSSHLIEVLLYIGDSGFYSQVHELFKFPAQHCPDVLFMALLQFNPPMTVLRQDLITNLIPTFLANHPNSTVILHHAWNSASFSTSLRPIIMHSMADSYLRDNYDQAKLSRILDLAQDLKALSCLLNIRSFLFVIDLACLASRREYLKLEKWLSDKIREHGESFVQAIVKFLQRRCPQITGAKIAEDQIPKSSQLPHETLTTMLTCLQACANNVQPELCEIILQMSTNCNSIVNKSRQPPPPGVLRPQQQPQQPQHPAPPFNPINPQAGTIFGSVDALSHLSSNMSGLNLNGPNGGFNFGNVLGSLVSTPASPSRLINATSSSPFPILSIPTAVPNVNNIPRLPSAPNPATNIMPDLGPVVSKEVEDEANSYFQRIYNHPPHPTLSIDEVLDMLKRFKDSQNRREQEVYQCMLRNLFEEYRFFPQYPDKELQTTAQLFGGIIERNLVPTFVALGLALRCVLDALRKPEGSKMYYFGTTALDRFKTRLHQYNKYCEHVRSIQHFQDFPPHLIQYVEYGFLSQEPPNKPQGPVLPPSMAHLLAGPMPQQQPTAPESLYRSNSVTGNIITTPNQQKSLSARVKSLATATNIDTLLSANTEREEKVTVPPDNISDKTAFIFNNLSQLNLQQKCEEIKEIMTKEYWAWLAQYMVVKRASIEFNFHTLYSNFLDALKNNEILRMVTKETFRNIRVLLRSEKGIINFSDRTLLKNLGHWLGMMTLGRSRPILQVDIDLKSLIVEAYHKGQQELLYVVPFVAKVLESCAKSKVFKPPNPWTMGIMHVLGELHHEPDLKLNLKFEIEVLCKTLNIELAELKPIIYLKDAVRAMKIECQLSQPKRPTEAIMPPVDDQSMALNNSVTNPSPSISNESAGQLVISQPEPRFSYVELNINNYSSLIQHLTISPSIGGIHIATMKHIVTNAIERTITEWLQPVVDRSVRIALATTEQIVRKDFSLDPDEVRMRTAAHQMVRNLSAGLAMITCKDQLTQALTSNMKKALLAAVPQMADIDGIALQLANDNNELACSFMQKTAGEKAAPEIDRRLAQDFDIRKIARDEGKRYFDPESLAYQVERMPDLVRLNVGGATNAQFAVYNEFARCIPGFLPMTERDAALFLPKNAAPQETPQNFPGVAAATDDLTILYQDLTLKMEAFLNGAMNVTGLQLQVSKMHILLSALVSARRNRDNESAFVLLTRAVEALVEGLVNIPDHIEQMRHYRDVILRVLNMLLTTFGAQAIERSVTKCIFETREEVRYNLEAVKILITSHFVNLAQFDAALVATMDNGANYLAVSFAMQLVQHFLIDDRGSGHVTEHEFFNTIDLLARLSSHNRGPEGLNHLIDILRINHDPNSFSMERNSTGPTQYIHSGINSVRFNDCDDPPHLQEKTEFLLKDWISIYYTQMNANRDQIKTFGHFVNKMNMYGILKTDDLITRFFRQATQFCSDLVYRLMNEPNQSPAQAKTKVFQWIDAYVRLIALLVRHSGDAGNPATKINLLNKVLGIVAGVLLSDQDKQTTTFQQVGYQRFFMMLFNELSSSDPVLENLMLNIVTAFAHAYHAISPSAAPAFCYSWLELISHRTFMARTLALIPQQKGWPLYCQLLLSLFKYLAPFLRNAELAKPVQLLYKGTLRVLLVLLHDFPEFLCDYHFGFCDVIPPNCIQMRNIILAAFPRNMRLPDPFTPNLKVDMLPETASAPKIFTNYVLNIQPQHFKKDLDSYLKARSPVTFLSELRSHLQISNEPGMRYNIPLMNSLVLYVGTQAIAHIRSKNLVPNSANIAHSAHMDIFQNLAVDLDTEGRYLFLNAIANQLRYPNSHTHYFSCTVLHLFAEANSEAIQEQITRVLLERLIVNRPHPWGLLITFIELIKNPTYSFWDHDFVHCAPEIEKLFESVAHSCMVKANHQQQQIANIDGDIQEVN